MSEQPTEITPLEARHNEVAQYQQNIAMYTAILATLPTEWPSHLEQYKGSMNQHGDSANVDDLDDVMLLADLWYADQCRASIRSEMIEMRKAQAILNVLQA